MQRIAMVTGGASGIGQAVCRRLEGAFTLLAVDAVSSLGGVELAMDEWDVDVVVAGSQKALMTPPGLAFAAASDRAWQLCERRPSRWSPA